MSEPDVVCLENESRETLLARMDLADSDYAIGVTEDTNFVGVISRHLLDRSQVQNGDGVHECCDDSITPVLHDTALEEVLPMLSEGGVPVPVVDESNNFVGVATQKDLLKVVAGGL